MTGAFAAGFAVGVAAGTLTTGAIAWYIFIKPLATRVEVLEDA